jgi:hypothetical protein
MIKYSKSKSTVGIAQCAKLFHVASHLSASNAYLRTLAVLLHVLWKSTPIWEAYTGPVRGIRCGSAQDLQVRTPCHASGSSS